jgi:hypothetical protein
MTKADLMTVIADELKFPWARAELLVDVVFDGMEQSMSRNPRTGRNRSRRAQASGLLPGGQRAARASEQEAALDLGSSRVRAGWVEGRAVLPMAYLERLEGHCVSEKVGLEPPRSQP